MWVQITCGRAMVASCQKIAHVQKGGPGQAPKFIPSVFSETPGDHGFRHRRHGRRLALEVAQLPPNADGLQLGATWSNLHLLGFRLSKPHRLKPVADPFWLSTPPTELKPTLRQLKMEPWLEHGVQPGLFSLDANPFVSTSSRKGVLINRFHLAH